MPPLGASGVVLAIDLINTSARVGPDHVEHLPGPRELVDFLVLHGFEPDAPSITHDDLRPIHDLRTSLQAFFETADEFGAVAALNDILASTGARLQLRFDPVAGYGLLGQPPDVTWANVVGAAAAVELVRVLLESGRRHLGLCAWNECGRAFVDASTALSNRFCSHACTTQYSGAAHRCLVSMQSQAADVEVPMSVLVAGLDGAITADLALTLREAVNRSRGGIVNAPGNQFAAVFPISVADALACAIRIQGGDAAARVGGLRIGLCIGAVRLDRGAASGGPVDSATELCGLAQPGQSLASKQVHRLVTDRQRVEFRWLRGTATARAAGYYLLRAFDERSEQRHWELAAAVDHGLLTRSGMCGLEE